MLQGANLEGASLQGANLSQADLQGAVLKDARFDDATVLPDGVNWLRRTALTRFTDPNDPEFWRPDNPDSPSDPVEE
jgi:hypothetical protein